MAFSICARDGLVQPLRAFMEAVQQHGHIARVDTLEEALEKGRPEIFNTDQGSQFTSRVHFLPSSPKPPSRSAWMDAVEPPTTCSLNDYGGP